MFHAWTFPSICIVLFNKTHLNHSTRLSFKCQWRNGFAVKYYCACVQQKLKLIMASAKVKVVNFESYQQKFGSCMTKNLRNGTTGELQTRLTVNFAKLKYTPSWVSNKLSNYFGKEGALRNETRHTELMMELVETMMLMLNKLIKRITVIF